jgi:hypothetical protein
MNASASVRIRPLRSQTTIDFAARELGRYLREMAGTSDAAQVVPMESHADDGIRLGLFEDFQLPMPEGSDPRWDDAIHVSVQDSRGVIAGTNPRSVLFAVYRFLEENGCRWVRPGPDGDLVPRQSVEQLSARLSEQPTSRYRGHSNCGGSVDSIVEKIAWMPKVGLNTFYEEFFPPRTRTRFYARKYPTLLPPEDHSAIQLAAFGEKEMGEIKKRGLIFQAVGHGWTGAFFGLFSVESDEDKAEFRRRAEKESHYLAMVQGERRPHRRGGALYTELCYGNPEVRERLARCVADYAADHPEIDVIQFSMSDAMNLMCECPLCAGHAPSDFLVQILNAIDQNLVERNLSTRIGFFLYQETWWPPVKERINNPDRFLLKFCPIGRDYQTPYETGVSDGHLPPFVLNRNERISDVRALSASLRQWQEKCPSDALAFEYHLTWYHYFDPGQFALSRVMAEDIRRMPALALRGVVSCQVVRCYFPTAFAVTVHARCLWNDRAQVEDLAKEYFSAAFGEDGPLCARYMERLSELFVPGKFYRYVPEKDPLPDPASAASLALIPAEIEAFKPVVERNLKTANPVHALSWRLVFVHMELARLLAECLRAKAEGNQVAVDAWWDKVLDFILINEKRLFSVFDTLWFYEAFLRRANLFSPGFRSTGGFETRDVLNTTARLQDPRD